MASRHHRVDASSDVKVAHHGHLARASRLDQFVEDLVRDGLVKVPLVPERPEVELEGLQFHAEPFGDIPDVKRGEVRLPRHGAQTGELRG